MLPPCCCHGPLDRLKWVQLHSLLMDSASAFAAVALCAVASDGVLAPQEVSALRRALEYRRPYRGMSEHQMGTLVDGLLRQLRDGGAIALVSEAAAALDHNQCLTAFALAADLIHADRSVVPQEKDYLRGLSDSLQLTREETERILTVMDVLYRDVLGCD